MVARYRLYPAIDSLKLDLLTLSVSKSTLSMQEVSPHWQLRMELRRNASLVGVFSSYDRMSKIRKQFVLPMKRPLANLTRQKTEQLSSLSLSVGMIE